MKRLSDIAPLSQYGRLVRRLPSAALLATMSSILLLASGSVTAHHSYAMFDRDKTIDSDAIVRTWEFTSPHATLWVYINDAGGTPKLWGLEAPGPAQLMRNGWDKDTVKPGDKIKITLNPLRDGRNGGSLVKLVLADGRSMSISAPTVPGANTDNKAP